MSNNLPPLGEDPEFQAAAQALGRVLASAIIEDETRKLRETMESAMRVADPEARPVIIGQVNVLKVTHSWIAKLVDDPGASLHTLDAAREIQDAIFAGMRGEQYV